VDLPRHQSLLFPSMCGKLPRNRRIGVLDIGPAFPETIQFFSSYQCRLHFADLYSDPLVLRGSSHLSQETLRMAFFDSLAIPEGTRFDLVLLWDFPNYIDDDALRALDAVLRPYLNPGAMGHGFAVRTSDTRVRNQWYGIDQPHLFTIRQPREEQLRFYPHSQAILINLLTCFDIDRGMLLPDGRLEVSLRATPAT
jgi:hypothetical protein